MKILKRFLTAIILVLATMCVVNIYKISNQRNDTIGTLGNFDYYSDFDISTLETNPVFYYSEETGQYEYVSTYQTTINFDGTDNAYNLLVNDKPCSVIQSTAGKLYGEYNLSFNDLDNNELSDLTLKIEYKFYVSKIELSMKASLTEDQAKLLNEYFSVNGCELRIIENVYYGGNEEELQVVYVNFYDNQNNLVASYPTAYDSCLSADYIELLNNLAETETQYASSWKLKNSEDNIYLPTHKFTRNTDIVAYYVDKPKVEFMTNNNTGIINEIYNTLFFKPGETFTINDTLVVPEIENYVFSHYSVDGVDIYPGQEYTFEITKNTLIIAHYTFNGYIITFDCYSDGGKFESAFYELNTLEEIEDKASFLISSGKTNLVFLGWTIDNNFIDIATYDFNKGESYNIVALYEDPSNVTTFNFYNMSNLIETKSVASYEHLMFVAPKVTHTSPDIYMFIGWTTDSNSSSPIDLSTLDFTQSEISLYACYKSNYQVIVYDPYDTSIKTVAGRYFAGDVITYEFLTTIVPEKENYVLTFTNTTTGVVLSKDGTQSFVMGSYHSNIYAKYLFNGYTFSVEIPSLSFQKVKLIEIVNLSDLLSMLPTEEEIPSIDGYEYKGIYYGYSSASPRIDGIDADTLSTYGFEKSKKYTINLIYEPKTYTMYVDNGGSSDFYVLDNMTPITSFPYVVSHNQYYNLVNQRYGHSASVTINDTTYTLAYLDQMQISIADFGEDIYISVTWTKV